MSIGENVPEGTRYQIPPSYETAHPVELSSYVRAAAGEPSKHANATQAAARATILTGARPPREQTKGVFFPAASRTGVLRVHFSAAPAGARIGRRLRGRGRRDAAT